MPNKIIISDAAYDDLDQNFLYISCNLDSPSAAQKLIDKTFDSIELLSDFPLIGSIPKNDVLRAKGYRLLIVDNFIVFYIPDVDSVHITRVMNGRRDWENILLSEKQ